MAAQSSGRNHHHVMNECLFFSIVAEHCCAGSLNLIRGNNRVEI